MSQKIMRWDDIKSDLLIMSQLLSDQTKDVIKICHF